MDPLFDREYKPIVFNDTSQKISRERSIAKAETRDYTAHYQKRCDKMLRRFSWEDPEKTIRGTYQPQVKD